MPATVAALGLLSVVMLVWMDHISQRQREHFALANEIMDLRVSAATAHLWLEEAIAGSDRTNMGTAQSDFSETQKKSETILSGGPSEHGHVLQPVANPDLRRRAEDLRRLVFEFNAVAQQRLLMPAGAGEGSPLDVRIDRIFADLQRAAADLESVVEGREAVDHRQSRRLASGLLFAWSSIVVLSTLGFQSAARRRTRAEEALQESRDQLETKVAARTGQLRRLNEALTMELTERKKVEVALRKSESECRDLSSRLLAAQEVERRRISRELHDELGQSLAITKLKLGCIKSKLRDDQSGLRADCESLSRFIVQVIEDVRRLSLDLSPAILDDLGLSAAVRWLVNHYPGRYRTYIACSIADIDDLFSRDARIVVYRVVQEALTNAAKHATAERLSVTVERDEDQLRWVIEDDGKGFDVQKAAASHVSERGLGLSTMGERARMLGGSLSVSSEEGKGTRITLAVPVRGTVSVAARREWSDA